MVDEKRTAQVVIRVTPAEKKALVLAAKDARLPVSTFLLAPVVKELREKGYLA